MTKKDYEAIAEIIKNNSNDKLECESRATATAIAVNLACYMATTNPSFDREHFLAACGVK